MRHGRERKVYKGKQEGKEQTRNRKNRRNTKKKGDAKGEAKEEGVARGKGKRGCGNIDVLKRISRRYYRR